MWIQTPDGFVSIVQYNRWPNDKPLVVRARRREHLERLFPDKAGQIIATPGRDYAYRLIMGREDVLDLFTRLVTELNYLNFKDEATSRALSRRSDDMVYPQALHEVWDVLGSLQDGGPYAQPTVMWCGADVSQGDLDIHVASCAECTAAMAEDERRQDART